MRSSVLALRSRVYWMTGRWDEAFEAANGAVAALAGLPESSQLARALARRSQIEMLRDRHEAIEHSREAIAVADRVGDVFADVNARINLFTASSFEGAGPDADEVLAIVDAATSIGAHEEAARAVVNFVWSAPGFLPVERSRVGHRIRPRRALAAAPEHRRLPRRSRPPRCSSSPPGAGTRRTRSSAAIDGPALGATSALVWRPAVGGLALRRGDLARADELLADMRPLAMASGEPQRILPMACVVLPWLFVSGRGAELRSVTEEVLDALDGHWPAVMSVDAVVRTLFAAKEFELLAVIADSLGHAARGDEAGRRAISLHGRERAPRAGRQPGGRGRAAPGGRHGALRRARTRLRQRLPEAGARGRARTRGRRSRRRREMRRETTALFSALRCVNPF